MSIPQCIILEITETLSQWKHILWFWLSISGNSNEKLHWGKVVNMPYCWWIIVLFVNYFEIFPFVFIATDELQIFLWRITILMQYNHHCQSLNSPPFNFNHNHTVKLVTQKQILKYTKLIFILGWKLLFYCACEMVYTLS